MTAPDASHETVRIESLGVRLPEKVVTTEELSAAPDALKKLDKNGDGKLTPEEFLAPRRRGPGGPGGPGMRGPGGFGGPPPQEDTAQPQ